MISPDVRIVDVDSEGLAFVNAALSERDKASAPAVMVLHDGRHVVRIAAPADVPIAAGDPIGDPRATAARIQEATGALSVTLVDERQLDALSSELVELGRSCPTQGEVLWRARELWNSHAAIVQVPPPGLSRWRGVSDLVGRVPDGRWIVLRICRDESRVWTFAARVEGGVVIEITSAHPPPDSTAVTLEVEADRLHTILTAPNPLARLYEEGTWRL